jgi:ubiquinone biosynthesis monooxygenase Coq6
MFKNVIRRNFNNKNFSTINSEVLIVGGGVPGLSLAAALLKNQHFKDKITLIDQPMKLNDDFMYSSNRLPDLRVISLTPASLRFFKSIGLWQHIDERLVKYVNYMQFYESKGS